MENKIFITQLDNDKNYSFYNMEAIYFMKNRLKSNSVDLIIADPPYFEIYGEFDFGKFKNVKEYLEARIMFAVRNNRQVIGCEINKDYYIQAINRIGSFIVNF